MSLALGFDPTRGLLATEVARADVRPQGGVGVDDFLDHPHSGLRRQAELILDLVVAQLLQLVAGLHVPLKRHPRRVARGLVAGVQGRCQCRRLPRCRQQLHLRHQLHVNDPVERMFGRVSGVGFARPWANRLRRQTVKGEVGRTRNLYAGLMRSKDQ